MNPRTFLRKELMHILFFSFSFFIFCLPVNAFNHGYTPDYDYIYALNRQELAIYTSAYGDDLQTTLPKYNKVTVIGTDGSWYEVWYSNGKTANYGWVTREDFKANCLIYDGREKQIIADGTYRISNLSILRRSKIGTDSALSINGQSPVDTLSSWTIHLECLGDDIYEIYRNNSEVSWYLRKDQNRSLSSLWGTEAQKGTFLLVRKGSYYAIKDTSTNRYLSIDDIGLLSFQDEPSYTWRFVRTQKAVSKKTLRDFVQFDPEWATTYYGSGKNSDPTQNIFCTSGCGVFAAMNAIYSLTGHYPDPYELADYAVKKHYRIVGYGTDSGFFKATAKKFGKKYNFKYHGSSGSISELQKRLLAGEVAIVHLPGHYGTIVDYNKKTKKYLLLDPHYLAKRGTSSFGDWISASELSGDSPYSLYGQEYYFYQITD